MKKIGKIIKENYIYLAIICITTIVFIRPYYMQGFVEGSDGMFHMARIASIVESMKCGIFPPKLRPILMKTYGYGVGFFYPDLFLYIPAAIMSLFHLEVTTAYKIYFAVFLFILSVIDWKCFSKISGSKKIGIFGIILYVLGNYSFWDAAYYCGAVGITHAIMFAPIAICGLIMSIKGEDNGHIVYGIGLYCVLLSHHITFMILMLFIFVYIIINVYRAVKNSNPPALIKIIIVSFVAMFCSIAYWLPAMEQALDQQLKALYLNIFSVQDNIMTFEEAFSIYIKIPLAIIYVISLGLFLLTIIIQKKSDYETITINISLLFIQWFACSKIIWNGKIGKVFSFLQGTERFMVVINSLIIVAIIMNLGFWLKNNKDKSSALLSNNCIFIGFTAVCSLLISMFVGGDYDNPLIGNISYIGTYELLHERYNGSGGEEWLPIETRTFALDTPETAKASDGSTADGSKISDGKMFDVWVLMDKEYYDMPYVYYKGYHAYLLNDDGTISRELGIEKAFDDNGLLRVYMPDDLDGIGHVQVMYRKTRIQKLAYVLNFAFIVILIVCCVYYRKKNYKWIGNEVK